VLLASAAELVDHERVLQEIAKESKGNCLWTALDTSTQEASTQEATT